MGTKETIIEESETYGEIIFSCIEAPKTQLQLAQEIGKTKSTINPQIKKLEEAKYLTKIPGTSNYQLNMPQLVNYWIDSFPELKDNKKEFREFIEDKFNIFALAWSFLGKAIYQGKETIYNLGLFAINYQKMVEGDYTKYKNKLGVTPGEDVFYEIAEDFQKQNEALIRKTKKSMRKKK